MIRGGLGTMASRNPTRGFAGALQSFGEGNVPAIEGFAKMQQARAETAIKGDEKARDRAQKRFESLVKMKTQQLKSRLPLADAEEREAQAYYEVLHTMTPKELAMQGITAQDLVNMKSSLGGSKGGSKGALKQNATGGFDYTPAKQ